MSDHDSRVVTVRTADDWARINDALDGFDDGIIKETWLDRASWLAEDDRVSEQGYPTAIVVVQLQGGSSRSVRLQFDGVRVMAFDLQRDVRPARAQRRSVGWVAEFLSCRVEATRCTAELLGDRWLGPGPFLLRPYEDS